MTCYIAAPFPERAEAVRVAALLRSKGIEVTSRWLTEAQPNTDAGARMNLLDVARADVLLAINPERWCESGTGGRHVELGAALTLGKIILLVGIRSHIFHYLNDVELYATADVAVASLVDRTAARE